MCRFDVHVGGLRFQWRGVRGLDRVDEPLCRVLAETGRFRHPLGLLGRRSHGLRVVHEFVVRLVHRAVDLIDGTPVLRLRFGCLDRALGEVVQRLPVRDALLRVRVERGTVLFHGFLEVEVAAAQVEQRVSFRACEPIVGVERVDHFGECGCELVDTVRGRAELVGEDLVGVGGLPCGGRVFRGRVLAFEQCSGFLPCGLLCGFLLSFGQFECLLVVALLFTHRLQDDVAGRIPPLVPHIQRAIPVVDLGDDAIVCGLVAGDGVNEFGVFDTDFVDRGPHVVEPVLELVEKALGVHRAFGFGQGFAEIFGR